MWTFQNLLFTLCTALSSMTCAADVIPVFGYEGRNVEVSCSYPDGYEDYEKYLCRDDCSHDDVLITTSQTNKNRYSIYDNRHRRLFTTTISDVRFTDAGRYWCGVSRNAKDIYTEVKLEISPDSCCDEVTKIQSDEEDSASISCPYEPENVNNLKFICRGKQPSSCLQQALVTSDRQNNGPIRLTDDRKSGAFTVSISSLTLEDSGSYLCGVHRNTGLDVFSAVELEVKEWCCVKPKNMTGLMGLSVTFQCPYPPEHRNNRRFICKGNRRRDCTDMMMSGDRFSLLNDSPSSFSVTITMLEAGDAGIYWCRSDPEWKTGDYTQFHLSVVDLHQTSTVETVSSHLSEKEHIEVVYAVLVVPAVLLLVLIFGLVTVCKRRCYKVKEQDEVIYGNRLEAVNRQKVMEAEDIYENLDALEMHSQQKSSKQQREEPEYGNITGDDIYCNENTCYTYRK